MKVWNMREVLKKSFFIALFFATIVHADGALDPSFNGTGIVVTPIPGHSTAEILGTYIQADGKIVVVGSDQFSTDTSFIVARYLTNGSLDASFGTGGIEVISLVPLGAIAAQANGVAVESNGNIVIVGSISLVDRQVGGQIFAARLNPNGTLDTTFNASGTLPGVVVLPHFQAFSNDEGNAIVVDVDGKIVVVGLSNLAMAIGRINADGSLDTTLNGSGQQIVHFNANSEDAAFAVALQADGKTIIAAGSSTAGAGAAAGQGNFAFARLNPNGTIDITRVAVFSTNATDQANITTSCQAVLVQPDGKIVLIGWTDWFNSQGPGSGGGFFALARYNSNGTLDTSFVGTPQLFDPNQNPGTLIAPSDTSSLEFSQAFAGGLQSDGKIIAGGFGPETENFGNQRFIVARFLTNGVLDATFTGGGAPTPGFVYTAINIPDQINALALQGNGDIVAAGSTAVSQFPQVNDFALARYVVSTPLQLATITTPINNSSLPVGPVTFAGLAQNPSIVDFFLDGVQIQADSTNTIGTGNTWSIPNVTVSPGVHTATVVGRYRDDGHVNLEAQITFRVCTISVSDLTIDTCQNRPFNGNLGMLVTDTFPPYTFALVGTPVNGTVSLNSSTGAFTFTPTPGFVGVGSFQFQVTDSIGCVSNVATVTVNIPCCPPTNPFFALIEELYFNLLPA